MLEILELNQDRFSNSRYIQISFETQSNKFILNSLLPPYWQVVQKPGVRLHTDPEKKRIFVPNDFFSSPGNVFSFVHEIGHANLDESRREQEIDEEIFLRDKFTYLNYASFTEEEKEAWKEVINSEKQAWNYALQTLEELKSIGIELEPTLTQVELEKIASQKLSSYFV